MAFVEGKFRDVTCFTFGIFIGILLMLINMDKMAIKNNIYSINKRFTREVSKKDYNNISETVWPTPSRDKKHKNNTKNGKELFDNLKNHTEKDKHLNVINGNMNDGSIISNVIYENVRILCWIMTHPNNTYKKAIHINETWGKKCTKLIFINADMNSNLPSVDLNVTDGRKYLWQKTKKALAYLYKTELNNYDWFLKADDDTYVIMENLRFMLLAYPPTISVYFGCKFKKFVNQGYMSGGAGYVLSRKALKDFNEIALVDHKKCKKEDTGSEDVELGKCLQNAGVIAGDSRDKHGKHRMFPLSPFYHLHGNNNTKKSTLPKWFHQYMYYPYNDTKECCSDFAISFHYVTPQLMYTIHNLLYHIQPFGLKRNKELNNLKENENPLEFAKKLSRLNAHKLTPPKEMQLFSSKSSNTRKHKKAKHENLKNTTEKSFTTKKVSLTTIKDIEFITSTKHP